MVDPINAKPVAATERASVPVQNAPIVQPPVKTDDASSVAADRAASPVPAPAAGVQALVSELSAQPPVDEARVARIRNAIANGTYPISPENIADRLIALKLNWIPHDPS